MSTFSLARLRATRSRTTARPLGSNGASVGITVGALVFAVLLGFVATTANVIFVAFAVTLVLAPLLLLRPVASIWLLLIGGLLVAGVVPIWAAGAASKAAWALSGLSFLLLFVVLIRAMTTARSTDHTPPHIWLSLAFLVYVLVNSVLQFSTAYELLGGLKRYFQAYGLLLCLAWLPFDEKSIGRWRNFMILVALTQLPWAIYERVKLVPLRTALAEVYPGLVPIDVVAGTFGAHLNEGGANAEMATFLLIVLAFLLARLREGVLPFRRVLWLAPLVMAPLFLGETKVVVIFMPMLFLVLYRRELWRKPHVALLALSVGAILTVAAGAAYLSTSSRSLQQQWNDTVAYNFTDHGYGGFKLNRTTTLSFWFHRQGVGDPVAAVAGHGVGTAHDSTGGSQALQYWGFGLGLTSASLLLWEQGVAGLLLYASCLIAAGFTASKLRKRAREPWVRADAAAIEAAMPVFLLYLFYRAAQLEGLAFQMVIASLLGYLAWLYRRECNKSGPASS